MTERFYVWDYCFPWESIDLSLNPLPSRRISWENNKRSCDVPSNLGNWVQRDWQLFKWNSSNKDLDRLHNISNYTKLRAQIWWHLSSLRFPVSKLMMSLSIQQKNMMGLKWPERKNMKDKTSSKLWQKKNPDLFTALAWLETVARTGSKTMFLISTTEFDAISQQWEACYLR